MLTLGTRRGLLLSVTGGQAEFRCVKVTREEFVSFIFIFHRFAHKLIIFK